MTFAPNVRFFPVVRNHTGKALHWQVIRKVQVLMPLDDQLWDGWILGSRVEGFEGQQM